MRQSTPEKAKAQTARMPELDGLRALAVIFVICFHSWYFLKYLMPSLEYFIVFSDSLPWVLGFLRRGDLGVDIFFVLSGYLLSWQLFRKRNETGHINVPRFYAHRIFRIYPLYIVALLVAAIDVGITTDMLGNLLAYNIWFSPTQIIIPWSWSLSVELQFYAIVPLLIWFVRGAKTMSVVATSFAILTVGWIYWILHTHPAIVSMSFIELMIDGQGDQVNVFYDRIYISMPVRLSQFTFGMAGAWLVLNRPSIIANVGKLGTSLMALFIILGATFPLWHNPFTHHAEIDHLIANIELLFGRVVFAAAISLMIVLMHLDKLPRLKQILSHRLLEPIARFSFSMYLFHPVFIYVGIWIFIGTGTTETISALEYLSVCSVAIIGSMLFGYITWYMIEQPAIRFGRKKFG